MRAVDHYAKAEDLLEHAHEQVSGPAPEANIAAAQVHATLALAGATAMQAYSRADDTELDDWAEAAGGAR